MNLAVFLLFSLTKSDFHPTVVKVASPEFLIDKRCLIMGE